MKLISINLLALFSAVHGFGTLPDKDDYDPNAYQGNDKFPKVLKFSTFWPDPGLAENGIPHWGPEQLQEQSIFPDIYEALYGTNGKHAGDTPLATAFYYKQGCQGREVCGFSVVTGSSTWGSIPRLRRAGAIPQTAGMPRPTSTTGMIGAVLHPSV